MFEEGVEDGVGKMNHVHSTVCPEERDVFKTLGHQT